MSTIAPSAIQTDPAVLPVLLTETWDIGNDVTAQLAEGDTITNESVTLVDVITGVAVTGFTSSPSVTGNVISQVLVCSILSANRSYRMTWTFTANTNKVESSQTIIQTFPAP